MGPKFGELAKMRGIVVFKISHHEQNALAGCLTPGIQNFVRRVNSQILYVATPFLLGYTLVSWAKKDHERQQRKDPRKFAKET